MEEIIFERAQEFTPEIADAIRYLTDILDKDHQPLSDSDIQEMLNNPSTHLIVAKTRDTGKIIGMATLIVYRIPYKVKAQLEDVVIDPRYRGQGIGTKLVNFVIEEAVRAGVKSLNLTSRPERESANLLYLKVGFQKRDTNVYRMDLE